MKLRGLHHFAVSCCDTRSVCFRSDRPRKTEEPDRTRRHPSRTSRRPAPSTSIKKKKQYQIVALNLITDQQEQDRSDSRSSAQGQRRAGRGAQQWLPQQMCRCSGGCLQQVHGAQRERCSKQGGRFTFPLLGTKIAFWAVHVAMVIALPGLLSTAMARQHLDLFAMWFAGGGVTQIFRMPRRRKQRFRTLRGLM